MERLGAGAAGWHGSGQPGLTPGGSQLPIHRSVIPVTGSLMLASFTTSSTHSRTAFRTFCSLGEAAAAATAAGNNSGSSSRTLGRCGPAGCDAALYHGSHTDMRHSGGPSGAVWHSGTGCPGHWGGVQNVLIPIYGRNAPVASVYVPE